MTNSKLQGYFLGYINKEAVSTTTEEIIPFLGSISNTKEVEKASPKWDDDGIGFDEKVKNTVSLDPALGSYLAAAGAGGVAGTGIGTAAGGLLNGSKGAKTGAVAGGVAGTLGGPALLYLLKKLDMLKVSEGATIKHRL